MTMTTETRTDFETPFDTLTDAQREHYMGGPPAPVTLSFYPLDLQVLDDVCERTGKSRERVIAGAIAEFAASHFLDPEIMEFLDTATDVLGTIEVIDILRGEEGTDGEGE